MSVRRRTLTLGFIVGLLGLISIFVFSTGQPAVPVLASVPSAENQVDLAWQKAQELGVFHYRTSIVQTTWPAPKPENMGLSSRTDETYLEGETNLRARTMRLKLWSGSGNVSSTDSLEIQVANARAQGRVGAGDWQDLDEFSNVFAPDNDPLTYLVATKNISQIGQETRSGIQLTRFSFEIDGPKLAEHMRQRMEMQLRQQGKLPLGVHLSLPEAYRDMTGNGEIWVGRDDLPLRLMLSLDRSVAGQDSLQAEIKTDFFDWSNGPLAGLTLGDTSPVTIPVGAIEIGATGLTAAVIAIGLLLMIRHWRSRLVYRSIFVFMVASLILPTILQGQQLAAYATEQDRQRTQVEEQHKDEVERQAQSARTAPKFDPHTDPLTPAASPQPLTKFGANQAIPLTASFSGIGTGGAQAVKDACKNDSNDTDKDGLCNSYEVQIGTSPSAFDTDGDGLSDGVEVMELGTNPLAVDSDGDGISDSVEVRGYVTSNNVRWYLNPLDGDTNHDGRLDGLECPTLVNVTRNSGTQPDTINNQNPSGVCQDSDGDGTPDIYDTDDDNDGVPDASDLAPLTAMGSVNNGVLGGFTNGSFDLKLTNQATNTPMLVEFQLRPADQNHLWYALNVLDWAQNDRDGQIQHVLNTTFGTSGKDANGDMRLTPMLEVEIPYRAGQAGSLPIRSDYNGQIGASTPVTAWLDTSKLDPFGISVRRKDSSGTLIAYVPLNIVRDRVGSRPVAFSGTMYYQPAGADFLDPQKVRLVWVVQIKSDYCDTTGLAANSSPADYDRWCAGTTHWKSIAQPTIAQSYYDDWFLTGLTAREDHGAKVAIVSEDPDVAVTRPGYDANTYLEESLWFLAKNLNNSFLAGRGNTSPDITVDVLKQRFDKDSNSAATDIQRWGIPRNMLRVSTNTFAHQALQGQVPVSITRDILNARFLNGSQPKIANPTLLFVREESSRTANLTSNGFVNGNSLTVSLAPGSIPLMTIGSMSWAPYEYQTGSGWQPAAIDTYLNRLQTRLHTLFQSSSTLNTDIFVRNGAVLLAGSFYTSMLAGTSQVIAIDDKAVRGQAGRPDAVLATDNPLFTGANIGRTVAFVVQVLAVILDKDYDKMLGKMGRAEGQGTIYALGRVFTGDITLRDAGLLVSAAATVLSVLVAAGLIPLGDKAKDAILGGAAGLILVTAIYEANIQIKAAMAAYNTTSQLSAISSLVNEIPRSIKIGAVVGLIIGVGLAIAFFILEMKSQNLAPGSIGFNYALAGLFAQIAIAILYVAISLIPIIGPIIMAVIGVIDILVTLICKAVGVENKAVKEWVCGGITGILKKTIQYLLFSDNPIVNLSNPDRLQISNLTPSLANPAIGYTPDAIVNASLQVTSKIFRNTPNSYLGYLYWWQYGDRYLRQSDFAYQLFNSEQDISGPLSTGSEKTNCNSTVQFWCPSTTGGDFYMRQMVVGSTTLPSPGVNRPTSLYLMEGSAINAQQCFWIWAIFVPVPICRFHDLKESTPINLGDNFRFDIFPKTFNDFYRLSPRGNGYYLAWDSKFPTLCDADGDGLRSQACGGNDRDDGNWDSDGDGLSDYDEVLNGTDMRKKDTDGDGLTDYQELEQGTNPLRIDSDGDGLIDCEEVFHQVIEVDKYSRCGATKGAWTGGWTFVYDFDANGEPKRTLVFPDPRQADSDGDTLLDDQEKIYGLNPRVASLSNLIDISSEVRASQNGSVLPNGTFVKPGQTLYYSATLENNLRDRYALGLLETDFPVAVQNQSVQPQPFELYPTRSKTMAGSLQVRPTITTSQQLTFTNRAAAKITDLNGSANLRSLWLHLNEDAGATTFFDSSLKGNNATCAGSTCPTAGVTGQIGKAAQFNGSGQTLTVSDTSIQGPYTIAAWVKPATAQAQNIIVRTTAAGPNTEYSHELRINSSGQFEHYLWDGSGHMVVGTTTVTPGKWYHLAAVATPNGAMRLYVNGLEEGTPLPIGTPWTGGNRFLIGSSGAGLSAFNGVIDEVELYPFPLSESQIAARVDPAQGGVAPTDSPDSAGLSPEGVRAEADWKSRRLHLSLDEPPGTTLFPGWGYRDVLWQGHVNYTVKESSGRSAVCSGSTCPAAGLPGRANQAARFDGVKTYLQTSQVMTTKLDYFTLAAWVKWAGPNGSSQTILYNGAGSDGYGIQLDSAGRIGILAGGVGWAWTNQVLPVDRWQHILVSRYTSPYAGSTANPWIVYLGDQAIPVSGNPVPRTPTSHTMIGAHEGTDNFNGLIDEVDIFDSSFQNTNYDPYGVIPPDVSSLLAEVPNLNLHLDDPAGSTTFVDSADPRNDARCFGSQCPLAGNRGQVRESALFDGQDDRLVVNHSSSVDINPFAFSVGLWVKPTRYSYLTQTLIAKGQRPKQSFALNIASNSMQVNFHADHDDHTFAINGSLLSDCQAGPVDVTSDTSLRFNAWNQVVVNYRFGIVKIYINGILDKTANFQNALRAQKGKYGKANVDVCYNESAVELGDITDGAVRWAHIPFAGAIDEAFIYREGADVYKDITFVPEEQYPYQASFYSVRSQGTRIIVDADLPTAQLNLTDSFVLRQDRVLCVTARDDTSYLAAVEYNVNNAGFLAATATGQAWCFTYQPGSGNTSTIQVRARDAVGNVSAVESKTVTVDGTPPAITLNSTVTQGVRSVPNLRLALDGTASDSGSGVKDLSVLLIDPAGVPISRTVTAQLGNPAAGGVVTWTASYPLPPEPNAAYLVQITANDNAGNQAVRATDIVRVDGTAPVADITSTGPYTTTISGLGTQRPTIQGTVSDIPYPSDPSLQLHFEESGGTEFADGSARHQAATCSANTCPTPGQTGKFGSAALFDGIDDFLQTGLATPATGSVALAAWVNWSGSLGGNQFILNNGQAGVDGYGLMVESTGRLVIQVGGFGPAISAAQLSTNSWHHVAAVRSNGTWVLYLDGLAQTMTGNPTPNLPVGVTTIGANHLGGERFNGKLDEVIVYGRSLGPDEIAALANPSSSGVSSVEVGFIHAKDAGILSSVAWQTAAISQTGQTFTAWAQQVPAGLEGPYQIAVRTTDLFGLRRTQPLLWSGDIDTLAPRLAVTRTAESGQFRYTTVADDYNLTDQGFDTPCGPGVISSQRLFTATWYATLIAQSPPAELNRLRNKADRYTVSCLLPSIVTTTVTARDLLGNVATIPTPGANLAEATHLSALAAVPVQAQFTGSDYFGGPDPRTAGLPSAIAGPVVTLGKSLFTTAEFGVAGQVELTGTISGLIGTGSAQVTLGGASLPAAVDRFAGEWLALWTLNPASPPDGQSLPLDVTISDSAGGSTTLHSNITADLVAPAPITLTVSYVNRQGVRTTVQPGSTISDVLTPPLTLTWTESADQGGIARYLAGWTYSPTLSAGESASLTPYGPAGREHIQATGEAQRIYAHVIAIDGAGNQTEQMTGPFYVDFSRTPDYLGMTDAGGPYRGWLTSQCSLLGQDYRLSRTLPPTALLLEPQRLYTTWNDSTLRLTWTGADWDQDGDLFIYLAAPGAGSTRAYDPFGGSLSVNLPISANYLIWVRGQRQAELRHWDGQAWVTVPGGLSYTFTRQQSAYTDLAIPFTQLGITNPGATTLGIIGFATRENELTLWSTLPARNPINAVDVVGTDRANGATFGGSHLDLQQAYNLILASDACPQSNVFSAAELSVNLKSVPAGRNLVTGEGQWSIQNGDLNGSVLGNGETVAYQLDYQNVGTETAFGATAVITTWQVLPPNAGAPVAPNQWRSVQALGDIPPGASSSLILTSTIAVAPDGAPIPPGASADVAEFGVAVTFDGSNYGGDLIRSRVTQFRLDSQPPRDVEIIRPRTLIGPGLNLVEGSVRDDAAVPAITLEIQGPSGTRIVPCVNPTPRGGRWSCTWDAGANLVNDSVYLVRARATDSSGHLSEWSPTVRLTADSQAAVLTVDPDVALKLASVLGTDSQLNGRLSDNRSLEGLEVCSDGSSSCSAGTIAIDASGVPTSSWVLDDVPAAPIAVGSTSPCPSEAVTVASFVVSDSFTVARATLGLSLKLADRSQTAVTLTSPAGTKVNLKSAPTASGPNLDVLWDDAAGVSLDDDFGAQGSSGAFANPRHPADQLNRISGENALGIWTLTVCDPVSSAPDLDVYIAARLTLTADVLPTGATGSWTYTLPVPGRSDGDPQSVRLTTIDGVGNRGLPITLNYSFDNVPPVITTTSALATIVTSPDQPAKTALIGTLSDGGGIKSIFATIQSPSGDVSYDLVTTGQLGPAQLRVAGVNTTWQFALRTTETGIYKVTIQAQDLAGNSSSIGPYNIMVSEGSVPQIYFPSVAILAGALGQPSSAGPVKPNAGPVDSTPVTGPTSQPIATSTPTNRGLPSPTGSATVTGPSPTPPTVTNTVTSMATPTPTIQAPSSGNSQNVSRGAFGPSLGANSSPVNPPIASSTATPTPGRRPRLRRKRRRG